MTESLTQKPTPPASTSRPGPGPCDADSAAAKPYTLLGACGLAAQCQPSPDGRGAPSPSTAPLGLRTELRLLLLASLGQGPPGSQTPVVTAHTRGPSQDSRQGLRVKVTAYPLGGWPPRGPSTCHSGPGSDPGLQVPSARAAAPLSPVLICLLLANLFSLSPCLQTQQHPPE